MNRSSIVSKGSLSTDDPLYVQSRLEQLENKRNRKTSQQEGKEDKKNRLKSKNEKKQLTALWTNNEMGLPTLLGMDSITFH